MTAVTACLALGGAGALLLALRTALHRGLAPASTVAGAQPVDLGLPAREVGLNGPRGSRLFAWYLPVDSAAAGVGLHPAAVLLHGWGGNSSDLLPAARALHGAGHGVLLLEARNHGRSERSGTSSLPAFADDLEHALDWLGGQPGVDARRCVALGHSVGAAAVLLVASRRPGLAAAVSISAFAHPEQVMRRWLAAYRVPYRPIGWLVNRYVERVIGARFANIAPLSTLPRARCPVLLVHGRQDVTVPVSDAQALWGARGDADVTLLERDGTHEHFDDMDGLASDILAFLQAHAAPGPG